MKNLDILIVEGNLKEENYNFTKKEYYKNRIN